MFKLLNTAFFILLVIRGIIAQPINVTDQQVMVVHKKALTVDTHVDTPMLMVRGGFDLGLRNEAPRSQVDFIRMKEGGLNAIFFAAFTSQQKPTPENTETAYRRAHEMIDSTYAACERYNHLAEVATSAEDGSRLKSLNKLAVYIGMENGFPLGTDLTRIKEFYDRGVRYITLSHSRNNAICDSSTDPGGAEHNGLSAFGNEVVREMNKLGMIIDVSHISDKAFFDVVKLSEAPVIASHSSVRAIARHPRNMSDEMIKVLARNGGVIQICLLDDYIKDPDTSTIRYKKMEELRSIYITSYETMSDEEKQEIHKRRREIIEKYPKVLPAISDMVDHIDHVKNLVGVDYVGIGSDFDGGGELADCEDVSHFPLVTREMLQRGYTEEEIIKVWGGNFFRVFREVEDLAEI